MAHSVDILLLIVLSLKNYRLIATEDCELAANENKRHKQSTVVDGRRADTISTITDILGPVIKYKFGITYPYGVKPYKGFTVDSAASYKTPPTNFFPMGSNTVTITQMPIPRLYGNPHHLGRPCDVWIRFCMKAYDTGYICAVAVHGTKYTFSTYCAMEFSNCKLKSNIWQLAYFGYCVIERMPDVGKDYDIEGDNFLEAAIINVPPFNPLTGREETLFRI